MMEIVRSLARCQGHIARWARATLSWKLRSRRLALLPALLAAGLVAGPLSPQHAFAVLVPCRSDPTVALSNLGILDLSAYVYDNQSDIQQVLYVLHGPVGTSAIGIDPTLGLIGPKERFQYFADQPANTYRTDTYVYTGSRNVSVVASSDVVSALTGLPAVGVVSTSGYNGQDLQISLKGVNLSGLL